jgi:hypothetical protein
VSSKPMRLVIKQSVVRIESIWSLFFWKKDNTERIQRYLLRRSYSTFRPAGQ